jgi:hypothetical protein
VSSENERRPEHHDPEREGPVREFELPPDLGDVQRKAVRLEWITIAYMLSAVVPLALTLGQSQAMKAAWIEDLLSLLPPAAFLIASGCATATRARNSRGGCTAWSPSPTRSLRWRCS